ncbi:hypothetical protein ACHQM5_002171 [Ranunculus cassubicifolius]
MKEEVVELSPPPPNLVSNGGNSEDLVEKTQFDKSLLELKDLRSQLHYAANFCESSFFKSKEKKMMMENTKEYICRALVTVVDHLGSVSMNLEDQLSNTKGFSDTEVRLSCLQQRLGTCQDYVQRISVPQQCWSETFRRHHTRYISLPNLESEKSSEMLRGVDDPLLANKRTPNLILNVEKEMPLFLYTYAHKTSLTKFPPADVNSVKKLSRNPSSGWKFPPVWPVRDPYVISIPRNPRFHFQETKKAGRNDQNRRLLQLPWRKSHRVHRRDTL